VQENKELIRRGFERLVNDNDLDAAGRFISESYVNYDFPNVRQGLEGFAEVLGMFRAAFPDMHVTIEEVIGEGDRVATRGYFTGTHTGGFMGIPPSGKPIRVTYIDEWRVENGKAVENWVRMDQLGLLQQIGAIPAAS
jgi:predicted ester cyclase